MKWSENNQPLKSVICNSYVIKLVFSSQIQFIAAGLYNGNIYLFDYELDKIKELKAGDKFISDIVFIHDLRYLVSCSDRVTIVWDLRNF